MEGVDESTELWRHQSNPVKLQTGNIWSFPLCWIFSGQGKEYFSSETCFLLKVEKNRQRGQKTRWPFWALSWFSRQNDISLISLSTCHYMKVNDFQRSHQNRNLIFSSDYFSGFEEDISLRDNSPIELNRSSQIWLPLVDIFFLHFTMSKNVVVINKYCVFYDLCVYYDLCAYYDLHVYITRSMLSLYCKATKLLPRTVDVLSILVPLCRSYVPLCLSYNFR